MDWTTPSGEPAAASRASSRPSRSTQPSAGNIDATSFARVSADSIESMELTELVRLIMAAKLPPIERDGLRDRLAYYDRGTLGRLAHLARRRHSVVASGTSEYFERPEAPAADEGGENVT